MLSKETLEWATNKLRASEKNVVEAAQNFWGEYVSGIQIVDENVIQGLFTINMRLYDKTDIKLEYERSCLDLRVKKGGEFIQIHKLTNKEMANGFDSYKHDGMLKNFGVLDRVVREM